MVHQFTTTAQPIYTIVGDHNGTDNGTHIILTMVMQTAVNIAVTQVSVGPITTLIFNTQCR